METFLHKFDARLCWKKRGHSCDRCSLERLVLISLESSAHWTIRRLLNLQLCAVEFRRFGMCCPSRGGQNLKFDHWYALRSAAIAECKSMMGYEGSIGQGEIESWFQIGSWFQMVTCLSRHRLGVVCHKVIHAKLCSGSIQTSCVAWPYRPDWSGRTWCESWYQSSQFLIAIVLDLSLALTVLLLMLHPWGRPQNLDQQRHY